MSSSSVRRVFEELNRRGIELRLVGAEVRYRPTRAMSETLAERLREIPIDRLQAELEARSDPLTAEVIAMFDGEIVPESEWGETVPVQAGGAS